MILYHGSNTAINGIDLGKCRPYKDFGKGFYLTDIREQAQRMATRTARMYSGNPTLTLFEFDLGEAQGNGLKVKVFDKPDREWAQFVMSNRDMNTPSRTTITILSSVPLPMIPLPACCVYTRRILSARNSCCTN